jgi:hypothetical protein
MAGMALLPISYTEGKLKGTYATAMVLQKVGGHYERAGLFKTQPDSVWDGKGRVKMKSSGENGLEVGQGWCITSKRFWLG